MNDDSGDRKEKKLHTHAGRNGNELKIVRRENRDEKYCISENMLDKARLAKRRTNNQITNKRRIKDDSTTMGSQQ